MCREDAAADAPPLDIVDWRAGRVAECRIGAPGANHHKVTGIHVIVRCGCGCAFMSTDAGIAYGMASAHGGRSSDG